MYLSKTASPPIALVFLLLVYACSEDADTGQTIRFNQDWDFYKADTNNLSPGDVLKMGTITWERISLPHTASLEPLVMKEHVH